MGSNLDRLIASASPAIMEDYLPIPARYLWQALFSLADFELLGPVLALKNGFFAFENALHFFPLGFTRQGYDLLAWNNGRLWREEYGPGQAGLLFFAEDLFGRQFALREGQVLRFDPETGLVSSYAASLEDWAGRTVADPAAETGAALAAEWQAQHGPLSPNCRLVPETPFTKGGAYSLNNLRSLDAVEGMRGRAALALAS